jgi:hypothetical protein
VTALQLAMAALGRPALPRPQEVAARFEASWPAAGPLAVRLAGAELLELSTDRATFTVALMPLPIPWSQLEGPCRSAVRWPQAEAELRTHAAHLLVTATSEQLDAVDLMLALTQLMTALVLGSEGVRGIYWGSGTVVHEPADFVAQALATTREHLPLQLWTRFAVAPESAWEISLATTGLAALGMMEVEITRSALPADVLVHRALNFAHFVLERGAPIPDKDTYGLSEEERFRVRHAASARDGQCQVYRLTLESALEHSLRAD